MTRGWWRIVEPEQVKTYVESLHPRGVREKELSRMLTRFMDFARESCLKVIHLNLKSSSLFFFIASSPMSPHFLFSFKLW
jgi:hypothetical protein